MLAFSSVFVMYDVFSEHECVSMSSEMAVTDLGTPSASVLAPTQPPLNMYSLDCYL